MTARVSAWNEPKFVDGVIHVLQTEGYLTQGLTSPPTSQIGQTVTWKLAGKGEATQMAPGIEERPALNADRLTVTATMQDWEANEWVNGIDLKKMTEPEIQVAQKTVGMALGRRRDKLLIAALDAATPGGTIGTGAAAIDPTQMIDAQAQILGQGIAGTPELICLLPYRLLGQMMLYREFASSEWVGSDLPLMKRIGARSWNGIHYVPLPDDYFAVPAANQAYGYVYMKEAVGFATPTDWKGQIRELTRVDYVPTKKANFIASTMSACAVVLQTPGLRRLHFSTNAAITRPTP